MRGCNKQPNRSGVEMEPNPAVTVKRCRQRTAAGFEPWRKFQKVRSHLDRPKQMICSESVALCSHCFIVQRVKAHTLAGLHFILLHCGTTSWQQQDQHVSQMLSWSDLDPLSSLTLLWFLLDACCQAAPFKALCSGCWVGSVGSVGSVLAAGKWLQGWNGIELRPTLANRSLCSHTSKWTGPKENRPRCFRTTSPIDPGVKAPKERKTEGQILHWHIADVFIFFRKADF